MLHFMISTALAVWIVFFGGAEKISGTLVSFFVVDMFAPFLTVPMLKVYVSLMWVVDVVLLLIKHASH
jgi:hypothetical protein